MYVGARKVQLPSEVRWQWIHRASEGHHVFGMRISWHSKLGAMPSTRLNICLHDDFGKGIGKDSDSLWAWGSYFTKHHES